MQRWKIPGYKYSIDEILDLFERDINTAIQHKEFQHARQVSDALEKIKMDLSKARIQVLREELMAKTWHPNRFRSWCLDTDDEFYLKTSNDN